MTFIEYLINNHIYIKGVNLHKLSKEQKFIYEQNSDKQIINLIPTGNPRVYEIDEISKNILVELINDFLNKYLNSFSDNNSQTIHKIIFDIEKVQRNIDLFESLDLDINNLEHIKLVINYIQPYINTYNYTGASAIFDKNIIKIYKAINSKPNDKYIAFVFKIPTDFLSLYLINNEVYKEILRNKGKNLNDLTEITKSINNVFLNNEMYVKFDFRLIDKKATNQENLTNNPSNQNYQENYIVISRKIKINNTPNPHINVNTDYFVYQLFCISIHENYN